MSLIQLYEIDDDYINYLRQFDSRVLKHSGTNYKKKQKISGNFIGSKPL
ncbi:MAG TPA: type III toxin-antitoxin system ToxN/AbiQ family toxin [Fusobacterium sp.]